MPPAPAQLPHATLVVTCSLVTQRGSHLQHWRLSACRLSLSAEAIQRSWAQSRLQVPRNECPWEQPVASGGWELADKHPGFLNPGGDSSEASATQCHRGDQWDGAPTAHGGNPVTHPLLIFPSSLPCLLSFWCFLASAPQ